MKRIFTLGAVLLAFLTAHGQEEVASATTDAFYLDYSGRFTDQKVPEIIWENPRYDNEILQIRKLDLSILVKSHANLNRLDIFVNDQELSNQRGFKVVKDENSTPYSKRVNTDLLLFQGENTIKVTAVDENGSMTTSIRKVRVDMDEMTASAYNRTDYAVLFATDEYDSWDKLGNPVNDAKTIADELKKTYGFEVEIVNNPTKKEVLQTLRKYSKMTFLPNDQLFVFFAGHGHFDQYFNQGYMVCKDSKREDEEKLSYISHSNLREIVNNFPCKHVFLTIDACFSGTFDQSIANSGHRGSEVYQELNRVEYINRKLKFKTRKYLTSGGKEYVSDGQLGAHSPFTRKFLEALRSYGGNDNILTLNELKSYVEKINPEPRFGEFGSNEPGSDFIFVVK